ncbi:hypothetical protein HGB07_09420 [Candidatus Roizmanbacteria bacterium]|nr:hypothetical protein [Candidatus Roizmanbacteria bacterium]
MNGNRARFIGSLTANSGGAYQNTLFFVYHPKKVSEQLGVSVNIAAKAKSRISGTGT